MEKQILLTHGDLQIPCYITEPEFGEGRRIVLGVHGLCGSAQDEIQTAIAEEMELFSAVTLRFDFPGHGSSPMDSSAFQLESCMDSLLTVAAYAKTHYPQIDDLCLFATGFGAYITLLCLDQLQALPGALRLVVQTPSVLMDQALLAMANISEPTLRAMDHFRFQTQRPVDVSYRFYQQMKAHPALEGYNLPFLILHGERDDFTPMERILQLRKFNERAKLVIIPGASHRFLEEGAWDMVLDLTRDWFAYEQVLVADYE